MVGDWIKLVANKRFSFGLSTIYVNYDNIMMTVNLTGACLIYGTGCRPVPEIRHLDFPGRSRPVPEIRHAYLTVSNLVKFQSFLSFKNLCRYHFLKYSIANISRIGIVNI